MTRNDTVAILRASGRLVLSGVPEGAEALVLADLAREHRAGVLHIARDDARARSVIDLVTSFHGDIEIIHLPAWDCLPYDRVSPKADVSAARMDALSRLVETGGSGPRLVVTTLNAALQRLAPRHHLAKASFRARIGEELDVEDLLGYCARNGFTRTGTVMEPGEFASRGGIIDIFPPGAPSPVRLDFFGDTLESIRVFDSLSQRTTGKAERLHLVPVSEIPMDPDSISRFRAGYRRQFGNVTDDDPLYTAISEGRKHNGMENWLPLFHEELESIFDYLPDAAVTHDHLVDEVSDARWEMIEDHYQARKALGKNSYADAPVYKPLPSDALYLGKAEWEGCHTRRPGGAFTPFSQPVGGGVLDFGAKQGPDFAAEGRIQESGAFAPLSRHLARAIAAGQKVLLTANSAGSAARLKTLLADHDIDRLEPVERAQDAVRAADLLPKLTILPIERGFEFGDLVLISEQDILGDRLLRRRRRGGRADDFLREVTELSPQDLVVHVEHGIGRYLGLVTIDVGQAPHDCLHVTYSGGDKLYVPVENIEVLSRYGAEASGAQLDRLGGAAWQARKAKLKQRLKDMADELIAIAAARALRHAPKIGKPDGMYDEFCARFAFQETEDQARAIESVFDDLGAGQPMDRLICGDVGFGKTEVALRAAFATVMTGGQVAVIAPTTLLARQHFQTFSERFAGLPVEIRQLSRLVGTKQAAQARADLASGRADIIIGTHALLGRSLKFNNLSLLIVDEEQHFGVRHKERLKQLRADVHVLTLTATPIPRTLQLALTGVKELSLIATAPVDRLAIRTFIMPFDPLMVREALMREHYRGGQTFYVVPRILDLPEVENFLSEHVGEVKYVIAHGQMPAAQLEEVMSGFYEGIYDVLLSTTIIESGLDIPTANTMIIHRADHFGLAQLYQLRGRIGRSKLRAYAYLTLPPRKPLTVNAEKRLKVLQSLDSLGAGFTLASHDLDIRGAGNLLGEEQSGHIREVGLELYQQMLEEAVAEARAGDMEGERLRGEWSPQINIGTSVLIPEVYVADLDLRLGLYRRIARLEDQEEIDGFQAELIDRFGALPVEVKHLLEIVAIKQFCRIANIAKIDAGPRGASLNFRGDQFANPVGLIGFINDQQGMAKLRPDHTFVYRRNWEDPENRLSGALWLARQLADIAVAEAAHSAA